MIDDVWVMRGLAACVCVKLGDCDCVRDVVIVTLTVPVKLEDSVCDCEAVCSWLELCVTVAVDVSLAVLEIDCDWL